MTLDLAIESAEFGFKLKPEQLAQLHSFRDLLAGAAQRFNLTAVREPAAIERRHLLESLAFAGVLVEHGVLAANIKLLDLGTGAGLPGLPIKIAMPSLRLYLLESHAKSCTFLRETIQELALSGAEVIQARAEDAGRVPFNRGSFDLITARAVAPLPVLLEYALPFLRLGGHLATTKGSDSVQEISDADRALEEMQGEIIATPVFNPPEGRSQTIVIVRKVGDTPDRYPRRSGIASKRPIR